jgi:acetyl-CoA C-acetyltransferase
MTEAYIFDAIRTPRGKGKSSGALHEVRAIDLLGDVLKELQRKNDLDTAQVDDGIFGCVTAMDDQGGNIGKAALLFADWDESVGGMQINRFCCSGLEAVNLAAMKIRSGLEDLIVAGGVESMSRVPIHTDDGPMLFDPDVVGKINYVPQGVAADLIATVEGFNREELDAYALQSHQRATNALRNGYFDKSIVPIRDWVGLVILDKDEHVRPDCSMDGLANLSPSFLELGEMGFDAMAQKKYPSVEYIRHLHTAGNSSGVVDGAAAVLVGSLEKGQAAGLTPRARVVATATVSGEPTIMLLGHIAAAKKVLKKAGLTPKDIDLWEVNEAFAAVILKFQRDMKIDDTILNVNGGAIALGHPLGATGAMLLGTVLDELERRGQKRALIALCGGAGLGVATIIERV